MVVEVFRGSAATVNSYIIIDEKEVVLIDALGNANEAENLAKCIREIGKPLSHVVITHGHPDHYMGLRVLRNYFPAAAFVVARDSIKEDIIEYSSRLERAGWPDGNTALDLYEGDPGMKPKSYANPAGFDYEKELQVLMRNKLGLQSGALLELAVLYQPTECAHMTIIYAPVINALFTADLVYNNMFYRDEGVDRVHAGNWVHALQQLKDQYREMDPVVYPGHGEAGTLDLLEKQMDFLQLYF
jgi:glyoxylase-like metal-dependent hydrolase (beta-lactamase superfamily II)